MCCLFNLNQYHFRVSEANSSSDQIAKIRFEYHESKRMALIDLIINRKKELSKMKVPKTPNGTYKKRIIFNRDNSTKISSKVGCGSGRATTSHTLNNVPKSRIFSHSNMRSSNSSVKRIYKSKQFNKTQPKITKNSSLTHIDYLRVLKKNR